MADNAVEITEHLTEALVAFRTVQEHLTLATMLAREDENMQDTDGQVEIAELSGVSDAAAITMAFSMVRLQRWQDRSAQTVIDN